MSGDSGPSGIQESGKVKFPRALAVEVARTLVAALSPCCERLIVAGSLRRRKLMVGDVEIVFIPRIAEERDPSDLFGERTLLANQAENQIEKLFEAGRLEKRLNAKGLTAWGEKNKLALHFDTGVPVDLFTATPANWWNYIVCRTGGAESNVAICNAAIERGWKWNPYGEGFSRLSGLGVETRAMQSEREVFEFVGLDYLEPWERR